MGVKQSRLNPVLRSLEEQIQPEYTALLIVDVQNDFVHPEGPARAEVCQR